MVFRVILTLTLLLISPNGINAQSNTHNSKHTPFYPTESSDNNSISRDVASLPSGGQLKVLAEFTRPGMRYNPLNNYKYGGCMLRIRKVANDDGSQEHYDISGYAVDQVDGKWIWHNHMSNSVKYDNVKGVYTAFVSGLGNVYFSI